jgi:hypothetical protein
MDEREQAAYFEGYAFGYRELLMHACRGLGRPAPGPDATPDQLRARIAALEDERSMAVMRLRLLCNHHGDNDWSDDLYLSVVIDKHLGRYLDASGHKETAFLWESKSASDQLAMLMREGLFNVHDQLAGRLLPDVLR